MIVGAETREGADNDAVIEAALRHDAMRLDGYVIAESRVAENTSRSNDAARTNFRFAEQLHAGLDDGVFARDDIGIDQDCFRQLNRHAGVHERAALPFAEDAVDFGKVRTCVATENFARILGYVGEDGFALRIQDSDRVSQVEFTMFVIWLYLGERRPEFLQREAVNRRIDFVDLALLVSKLRFFDDGGYQGLGFPHDSPVAGRIGKHRGENCGGCVSLMMRGHERLQCFRAHEWGVSRDHDRKLRPAQGAPGHLHGVARAVLRLLQNRNGAERLDHGGYLLRLMADDDNRLSWPQRH